MSPPLIWILPANVAGFFLPDPLLWLICGSQQDIIPRYSLRKALIQRIIFSAPI
jgi:hypothetical protein